MDTQPLHADRRESNDYDLSNPPLPELELQQLRPIHLRGDTIIDIPSAEPRLVGEYAKCRIYPLASKRKGIPRLKMALLRIFEGPEAKITDGRYDNFVQLKLEDQYEKGYPRLAAFIDSDVDYVMFRRFGILHARSLLYKQAELTELEEQLNELDKKDAADKATQWRLHSHVNFPKGDNTARKELMEKIDLKMKEYDEQLLRDHQIRNLRKPSRRLHMSVFNYVFNRHPTTTKDERFIYHRDDFVMLTNYVEFNWFDDIFHKFMDYDASGFLRRICTTKEDRTRSNDEFIRYYSRNRLGVFISTLIAFLSTILLLVPVYLLITIPMDMQMMTTVVLGFVFLFAASLSAFTSARRLDVFGATAAYSAVLVVFVANLQQGQQIALGN